MKAAVVRWGAVFHEQRVYAERSGYGSCVVTSLKHRLALAALVGVLIIPLLTTNNGGLSHLLFCTAEVAQPFAIAAAVDDDPQVTSSTSIDRADVESEGAGAFEGRPAATAECEGVRAEVSAEPIDHERVRLTVTIINDSEIAWRGSIGLAATGQARRADLTAAIGEVKPGERGSASLELRVADGQTDIDGTLLLGP